MLIEKISLIAATQTKHGYSAEIELETSDGFGFCGPVDFTFFFEGDDYKWAYDLGFLKTFVNTDEDKTFVHGVFTDPDFIADVRQHAA